MRVSVLSEGGPLNFGFALTIRIKFDFLSLSVLQSVEINFVNLNREACMRSNLESWEPSWNYVKYRLKPVSIWPIAASYYGLLSVYVKIELIPRSKHSSPVKKTSQLMFYRIKVALCSEIRT